MSFRPSNLFRWTGTVNRLPYFLAGLTLLVVKFGLDWLVARLVFERDWTLSNYLAAPANTIRALMVTGPARVFFAPLLVLALPFIWIGVALTVQRLRAARLPPGLVVFFFVPVVNLFFFVILSLLPTQAVPVMPAIDAGSSEQIARPGVLP